MSLVALTCLAALTAGCTRTVYVIQTPDGQLKEVDPNHLHQVNNPHKHPHDPTDPIVVTRKPIVGDDGVIIELLTSTEYVLTDGTHPLYLQLTVEGREHGAEVRPAMNLSIVIDRSGSMRGGKLQHAIRAAQNLVDRLVEGDRVSIVSYGTDLRVDVPSAAVTAHSRRAIRRVIGGLRTGGQTFLSGGLEAGADQVSAAYDEAMVNRVILLSDGRANVGIKSRHGLDQLAGRLFEQGVSVTTMGVGLDYNEDLMSSIAVAGGGSYYFIEHARDLAGIFDAELNTLASLVGQDAILYLELPSDVQIQDIYGYRYQKKGDELAINLNSVAAGQKRRVMIALDVPPRSAGQHIMARGRVEYRSTRAKTRRTVPLSPVAVSYTPDRRRVAASLNKPVMEKLEMVRNARARELAMKRLDAGDRAGANAIVRRRLSENRKVHQAVGGAALGDQVRSMESLSGEVRSAPAAASPAYRRLRKTKMKEAYDLNQY